MTKLFSYVMNPAVLGVLVLFLSIVWMIRDERDKTRPWLVFAFILNLFYGTALNIFMGGEGRLFPFKYDYILFHLDRALGISSTPIARELQGWLHTPLWWSYELMIPMMILWLIINRDSKVGRSITMAYIAELIGGPAIYTIVPACGPVYAFGSSWLHPREVPAILTHLTGEPNAFPSLHLATAFVLVFFARGSIWRPFALLFLAGTCMATISTGEHYIIDLFAGLAFGCFAAYLGDHKFQFAAASLGVSLLCSFTVRFGHDFLIAHPFVLRSAAGLIFTFAAIGVMNKWTTSVSLKGEDVAVENKVICSAAGHNAEPGL